MPKCFLALLLAVTLLAACNRQSAPTDTDSGSANALAWTRVSVDRNNNSVDVKHFVSEQGKLEAQQVTPPGEARELIWSKEFEDSVVDYQFLSDRVVFTFTFANITTNLYFVQPASLNVDVATATSCDSPDASLRIVNSFEIDVTDETLGGDGVLEPGETSAPVDVAVPYSDLSNCFHVLLLWNAAVTDHFPSPDAPGGPGRSGPLYIVADRGTLGTDGGVVYSSEESVAHVNILPGTFADSTVVTAEVATTPPSSYPEDIAAWVPPESIAYLGSRVETEFSAAALDLNPAEQFDLLYLVPALNDFDTEGGPTVAAEVRITLPDGSDYVYLDDYTPNGAVIIRNTTLLLAYGSANPSASRISVPGTIKISVQPIDFSGSSSSSSGLSTQSIVEPERANYEDGLFRIERDGPFSDSQIRAVCNSNFEKMPVGEAGRVNIPEGKTALVLVHGWQVQGQFPITAGTESASVPSKQQFTPALCSWQDFVKNYMNDESYSAGLEQLQQSYELFSFGYDSQKRVEENAREFGTKLRDVFGNQKVVVLAHSMGGLVANTHIQKGGGNVRHLITVGTPYEGSHFIICQDVEGAYCSNGILNMSVIERTVAAGNGLLAAVKYHKLAKIIASFPGTLDLAWQHGNLPIPPDYTKCEQYLELGNDDPTAWYLCRDETKAEAEGEVSSFNPFLQSINQGASYSKHTVFYGNAAERYALAEGFEFADAFQVRSARAMKSIYGVYSDGIVPISSACRLGSSTGTASNCSGSPFDNLINTEFTHTEIKNAPNMPAYAVELLRIADRLLDIDDGTLDGNQRLYIGTENSSSCADSEEDGVCDVAIEAKELLKYIDTDFGDIDSRPSGDARYVREGEDADGNERFGDGILDMSDYRRWRDHYLMTVGKDAYLDGSSNHVKKDMDGDLGLVSTPVEGISPRWADFNGDGLVSHDDRATVAGITPTADMPKNQDGKPFLTDLEVLYYTANQQELWEDEYYPDYWLPNLGNLGDIEIWVRHLYDLPNVVKVESYVDYDISQENRIHTNDPEGQRQVYTVPPGKRIAYIYATDKNGDLVLELQKTFDVKSGSDALWAPYIDFKPEIVKTYDSVVDDCARLEGTFTLELERLFDNGMPDIPLTDRNAMMTVNRETFAMLEKEKLNNEPLEVLAKTIRHCNVDRGPDQELGFLVSYLDEATGTGFYAHIYDTFENADNRWPTYIWNLSRNEYDWIPSTYCPPLSFSVVLEPLDGEPDEIQRVSSLAPGEYGTVYVGSRTSYQYEGLISVEEAGFIGSFPKGSSMDDFYIDEKTSWRGVEQWKHASLKYYADIFGDKTYVASLCTTDLHNYEYDPPRRDSSKDIQYPPSVEPPYLYYKLRKIEER